MAFWNVKWGGANGVPRGNGNGVQGDATSATSRGQELGDAQLRLVDGAVAEGREIVESLRQTAAQAESIATSGEELASSANEMAASIEQMSANATNLASSVAETGA